MSTNNPIPLCVDLDGTILATDVLHESLLEFARRHFFELWRIPLWLWGGRALLKRKLSENVELDAGRFPVNEEVLDFVRGEYEAGRRVLLVTAAERSVAEEVAAVLGCFHAVMASDGKTNLKGGQKLLALEGEFGRGGFDYIGDAMADRPIWNSARNALVVAGSEKRARLLAGEKVPARIFLRKANGWRAIFRAMRIHQWTKNILVIVPVISAHRLGEPLLLMNGVISFVAFSLVSSSVYIVNDLSDLQRDRAHPQKRNRAFASGALPLPAGVILGMACLAAGMATGVTCGWEFLSILGTYYILSFAYSWYFKRKLVLDVVVLSGFYTLRLFAGGIATGIRISEWLLIFSMFFFFSLALVKRFSELVGMEGETGREAFGRKYEAMDIPLIGALGVASGVMSVLVLALYVQSPEVSVLYRNPKMLLLMCPLLMYWIGRLWLLPRRGLLREDPVVFALRDKLSYVIGCMSAVIIYFATK